MDDLLEAVEALTKVRHVQIETDDGPRWVTGEPRLKQLQDEITATVGRGGGSAGLASERLPVSPEVLSRTFQIVTQIGDWCRMAGLRATRDPIKDLEAWHVTRLPLPETENTGYTTILQGWAREIDGMFDRPRPVDITVPCPACKARTYVDEDGDVCAWPLKAHVRPFRAECRACGAPWNDLEAIIELADELGIDVSNIHAEL